MLLIIMLGLVAFLLGFASGAMYGIHTVVKALFEEGVLKAVKREEEK